MLDTIELLEAIGSDALLRYASTAELTSALEQAKASVALKTAVTSGDSTRLCPEFGQGWAPSNHHVTQTLPEDDEQDKDVGSEPQKPMSPVPSAPDQGNPLPQS